MEYPNLLNNKFTIITEKEYHRNFSDSYTMFFGEPKKVLFDIEKYQITNDVMFNGHIIINNQKLSNEINFDYFKKLNLKSNNIFVIDVKHDGNYAKCKVNSDIIICNSWVLPIIMNNFRTNNSLYGDLIAHRINIKTFDLPFFI